MLGSLLFHQQLVTRLLPLACCTVSARSRSLCCFQLHPQLGCLQLGSCCCLIQLGLPLLGLAQRLGGSSLALQQLVSGCLCGCLLRGVLRHCCLKLASLGLHGSQLAAQQPRLPPKHFHLLAGIWRERQCNV